MTIGDRCVVEFLNPNDEYGHTVTAQAELVAVGDWSPNNGSSENAVNDFALLVAQTLDVSRVVSAPASVGTSANMKVNDAIRIEGYPNGTYSSTSGTISNITGGDIKHKDIFQVDAGAWPGSSGGALFNSGNQVVGMVTSGGYKTDENHSGQTFAIKIDHIAQMLQMKGHSIR